LFVVPADGSAAPRDLSPGANYDIPPDERSGPGDLNFSPDGKEICFTAVTDKMEAISTNGDLFIVPVAAAKPSASRRSQDSTGIRVLAGRKIHRLSRAVDARIRIGPLARDALRPAERKK